ncbi:MAG: 30S ribosome-binding factor RbfA [Proteobacteria bacterium]|nr:30S ribosome-binding factor RbfA [Pseudomonadota bacterium]
MTGFSRAERVGGQIQKIISALLLKDIKDPRLEMTTITDVKMSKDLKIARIYFTTTGGKTNADEALKGFKSAAGFLKRSLSSELSLRYMPEISFFYDESYDYGERIENVLKSIKMDS